MFYKSLSDRFKVKVISERSKTLNSIGDFIKLTEHYNQANQKSKLVSILSIYQ